MKQSNAYLIIIVTVIFVGITFIVSLYKDAENRRVEGERFLFPELSVSTDENSLKLLNEITEINVTNFNENFSIIRNEDSWYLPNLSNFPVPLDKIKRVIVGVAQLETIEPKTKNPDLHGELGLNDIDISTNTANKVTLINKDNSEVASILIGNDSKFGVETRYARMPDSNQSWLVWRNFDVPKSQIDWLDDSLFTVHRTRIADIFITHPDGHEVFIKRDSYAEQYFKLQNLDDDTLPINPYVGNQLGSALDNVSLVDIRSKDDISFTDNAITIVYTTFDGLKIEIKNENIKGFNWVSFNASSDINLRRELPKDGPVNVGLPEMDSYNDVEEEVIELNNNFRNWVFSLKNEKHQQFYSRLEDLTKKKDIDEKN